LDQTSARSARTAKPAAGTRATSADAGHPYHSLSAGLAATAMASATGEPIGVGQSTLDGPSHGPPLTLGRIGADLVVEVGDDGLDPAVLVGVVGYAELGEHGAGVRLDGTDADVQAGGDSGVG
jgi:hypothetical protein